MWNVVLMVIGAISVIVGFISYFIDGEDSLANVAVGLALINAARINEIEGSVQSQGS